VGEVAAVLEAVFEGARRAGGGVGEVVGEAWAESLLEDVGEAVVGVAGESIGSGVCTPGGGVAHRGRLLEGDADTAASGVFEGLFGLFVEVVVVLQAVTERGVCVCEQVREVLQAKQGMCSERDERRDVVSDACGNVQRKSVSQMCQRALTERQTLWGGGALERGHGAPLEPITQLSDTLRGEGAVAIVVEAAELVVAQAAIGGEWHSVSGR